MRPTAPYITQTSNIFFAPLFLCSSLCFAGVSAADAQVKVGMVDMNKVFSGYYKTKDAENKINDAREGAKKELDERMESHKAMLDEINALNKDIDNAALSATAKADRSKKRDDKIQQIKSLEQEINEFRTSRERSIQEETVRRRNQLVEEIMAVVDDRMKKEGYDFVFDKGGQSMSGVPFLLSAPAKLDFSDDVISQLNKSRPAAVPPLPSGVTPSPSPTGRK